MTLNTDLIKLVVELECEAKEHYDKLQTADTDDKRRYHRAKYEAYQYTAHKLKQLLKWYSVMEEID